MSITTHLTSSSVLRTGINMPRGMRSSRSRRQHLWFCEQIHSRTVFFLVQISLIGIALGTFWKGLKPPKWLHNEHIWVMVFGYAHFIGGIAGIWSLRLADAVYRRGCRLNECCAFPPHLLIAPSFIVQIGDVILYAYSAFTYVVGVFTSDGDQSLIFGFGTALPFLLTWLLILYIVAVEVDAWVYVANLSRHWRLPDHPPALLNIHTLNNDRFGTPSKRRRLIENALHEHERTKSSVSAGTGDSESKKSCVGTETKIEVIPARYAPDEMVPFFSEIINSSRKGASVIGSQLDTVPEESSKSTASYH